MKIITKIGQALQDVMLQATEKHEGNFVQSPYALLNHLYIHRCNILFEIVTLSCSSAPLVPLGDTAHLRLYLE